MESSWGWNYQMPSSIPPQPVQPPVPPGQPLPVPPNRALGVPPPTGPMGTPGAGGAPPGDPLSGVPLPPPVGAMGVPPPTTDVKNNQTNLTPTGQSNSWNMGNFSNWNQNSYGNSHPGTNSGTTNQGSSWNPSWGPPPSTPVNANVGSNSWNQWQNSIPTQPPPQAPQQGGQFNKQPEIPEFDESKDPELIEFDKQFTTWEKQFVKWKEENKDHPDKSALTQYEETWNKWRDELIQKREDIKKVKLDAIKAAIPEEEKDPVNVSQMPPHPLNQQALASQPPSHPPFNQPPPPMNNAGWSNSAPNWQGTSMEYSQNWNSKMPNQDLRPQNSQLQNVGGNTSYPGQNISRPLPENASMNISQALANHASTDTDNHRYPSKPQAPPSQWRPHDSDSTVQTRPNQGQNWGSQVPGQPFGATEQGQNMASSNQNVPPNWHSFNPDMRKSGPDNLPDQGSLNKAPNQMFNLNQNVPSSMKDSPTNWNQSQSNAEVNNPPWGASRIPNLGPRDVDEHAMNRQTNYDNRSSFMQRSELPPPMNFNQRNSSGEFQSDLAIDRQRRFTEDDVKTPVHGLPGTRRDAFDEPMLAPQRKPMGDYRRDPVSNPPQGVPMRDYQRSSMDGPQSASVGGFLRTAMGGPPAGSSQQRQFEDLQRGPMGSSADRYQERDVKRFMDGPPMRSSLDNYRRDSIQDSTRNPQQSDYMGGSQRGYMGSPQREPIRGPQRDSMSGPPIRPMDGSMRGPGSYQQGFGEDSVGRFGGPMRGRDFQRSPMEDQRGQSLRDHPPGSNRNRMNSGGNSNQGFDYNQSMDEKYRMNSAVNRGDRNQRSGMSSDFDDPFNQYQREQIPGNFMEPTSQNRSNVPRSQSSGSGRKSRWNANPLAENDNDQLEERERVNSSRFMDRSAPSSDQLPQGWRSNDMQGGAPREWGRDQPGPTWRRNESSFMGSGRTGSPRPSSEYNNQGRKFDDGGRDQTRSGRRDDYRRDRSPGRPRSRSRFEDKRSSSSTRDNSNNRNLGTDRSSHSRSDRNTRASSPPKTSLSSSNVKDETGGSKISLQGQTRGTANILELFKQKNEMGVKIPGLDLPQKSSGCVSSSDRGSDDSKSSSSALTTKKDREDKSRPESRKEPIKPKDEKIDVQFDESRLLKIGPIGVNHDSKKAWKPPNEWYDDDEENEGGDGSGDDRSGSGRARNQGNLNKRGMEELNKMAGRGKTPRMSGPDLNQSGPFGSRGYPGPMRMSGPRMDGPGGGPRMGFSRFDGPGGPRMDGPRGGPRMDGPGGGPRMDGPGGGPRMDGPGGGPRMDGPGGGPRMVGQRMGGPGGGHRMGGPNNWPRMGGPGDRPRGPRMDDFRGPGPYGGPRGGPEGSFDRAHPGGPRGSSNVSGGFRDTYRPSFAPLSGGHSGVRGGRGGENRGRGGGAGGSQIAPLMGINLEGPRSGSEEDGERSRPSIRGGSDGGRRDGGRGSRDGGESGRGGRHGGREMSFDGGRGGRGGFDGGRRGGRDGSDGGRVRGDRDSNDRGRRGRGSGGRGSISPNRGNFGSSRGKPFFELEASENNDHRSPERGVPPPARPPAEDPNKILNSRQNRSPIKLHPNEKLPELPESPAVSREVVTIDDIISVPGRFMRPPKLVIVLRGLPGSGKSTIAKMIKDREVESGGSAPRILCLDDYFMVEVEKMVMDEDTGRKTKTKVMEYEYEADLEEGYRKALFKSFRKQIDEGFFPFIIIDCVNCFRRDYKDICEYAKKKDFEVYVGELEVDVQTCFARNIHHRKLEDLQIMKSKWEKPIFDTIELDLISYMQDANIEEVEMEDCCALPDSNADEQQDSNNGEEDDQEGESFKVIKELMKSKWDTDGSQEDRLDKLDGIRGAKKRMSSVKPQSIDDWLQLSKEFEKKKATPGKKTVRWADIEERNRQCSARDRGFVLGETDWHRMTDPSLGSNALVQVRYIEPREKAVN